MANNLFADVPAAVVATQTISFASAGFDTSNTRIIYEVGSPLKSYVPGRAINAVTGFTLGNGYYIVPKLDMDKSAYLIPPIPEGGGGGGGGTLTFVPFNLKGTTVTESPTGTFFSATGGEGIGNTSTTMAGDGKLQMALSGPAAVLGLDTDGALELWTDSTNCFYKYCVFLAGGNFYTAYEGVLSTTQVNQGAVGSITHFRMVRTGTTVKLQTSTDGTTFTDVYTYPVSSSATLYAKGWMSNPSPDKFIEIKGEGFA